MYFISNENAPAKKSDIVRKLKIIPKLTDEIQTEPELISDEKTNVQKRVYGRARANLSFSSFYIFCEDFRLQLDYLYANKSEAYRRNLLNYMWKHLNTKDKHRYYETATKARAMYNLPEHSYLSENDGKTSAFTLSSRNNNTEIIKSNGSKVVGKLVKVKFLKSCTTPIITPLKVQNAVVDRLSSVHGRPQDEVYGFGNEKLRQDHGEISKHQDNGAEHLQPPLDHRDGQSIDERRRLSGGGPFVITSPSVIHQVICKSPNRTVGTTTTITTSHRPQPTKESTCLTARDSSSGTMLQQYQQQPDYTPYGGIGYGTQPNAGYFNYAASESSWYGSPSPGGDHAQMHAGLSHNACNTHIGDSTGNFMNHGYQQTTSTGVTTSSTESFTSNNHPVSQANMDPMADFLGGHQNMNENDKIIKEESIDWLSSIINDEVDHGNRQDVGDGGSGGGGIGGGGSEGVEGGGGGGGGATAATAVGGGGGGGGSGNIKLGDLPCKGHEPNGRLPNFHQAFGSTEIGRFSQHEYYEPPKDASMNECQSAGQPGVSSMPGSGSTHQEERSSVAAFEPPRLQNRRGRTQRGGGQHRRNKQTRAAAVAAVAAQQYAGYDMSGSAAGAMVVGGRHLQVPPYHHDPYNRNQQAQQQRYHQEYHHHHQQPAPPPSLYQNHQQEYYRPSYDRMHYQQPPPPPPPNQYYNNREQSYASGGYNNRFHSCCSTEHIARPNHHNYGPGQYYGDYNNYNQW